MKGTKFIIDTDCDNYKNGIRSGYDIDWFTVLEVQQIIIVTQCTCGKVTNEINYKWLVAAWVDNELIFTDLDQEEFMYENGLGLWKLQPAEAT